VGIYFRQDDLKTAQFLETRLGGRSGFAHSKTEHDGSVSTGESEQKIPVMTAQYIMYDMPDNEILGFWGKRPFLAKRIPIRNESIERTNKPTEAPIVHLFSAVSSFPETAKAEPLSLWRTDPALLRHSHPQ
jgi:hypothetical protein